MGKGSQAARLRYTRTMTVQQTAAGQRSNILKPARGFSALALSLCLALAALQQAQAQIYRCESPQGPVFADAPCGTHAQIIELREETAGISIGPQQEVRDYLAQRRDERSARREAQANAPQALPPQVITVQQPVLVPAFRPGYQWPRPPHNRPDRPDRPDRPTRPGQILPEPAPRPGNSILRVRDR